MWNPTSEKPEPGRKFIALYDDGSGAGLFFAFDGGFIDSDGSEYSELSPSYDCWAYLPKGFQFWCEIRSEEPMTLKELA